MTQQPQATPSPLPGGFTADTPVITKESMVLAYAAIARRVAAVEGLLRSQEARWPEQTLGLIRGEIQAAMEVVAAVEATSARVPHRLPQ